MTMKELEVIYNTKYIQAGDTQGDFYEWAINYLLNKEMEHKELITQISRHLGDIKKEIKKGE